MGFPVKEEGDHGTNDVLPLLCCAKHALIPLISNILDILFIQIYIFDRSVGNNPLL